MSSPQPKPPKPQYSFTSFQVNNPTAPPPGDKLDSEHAQTARVISDVIAWVGTSLNSDGSLKAQPKFDPPPIVGADSTAAASDYATLAAAWAEHMPDTIPPNILAFMDVTGDHWSSRWWANYAAQLVQGAGEGLDITAPGTLPQGVMGAINIRNQTGGPITIALPPTPNPGQTLKFKDAAGNAGTWAITIAATPSMIDGNSHYTLMSDYMSLEIYWMGDQWGTR